MGFFEMLFGNNNEISNPEIWTKIESVEDFHNVVKESYHKPIIIFKHSTSCFISKKALKKFENQIEEIGKSPCTYYYLDLLHFRPISNLVSNHLNVTHQSPQILLVKNGEVLYNASHENIDFQEALSFIN